MKVPCPPEALAYLKARDPLLGAVIDALGPVEWEAEDDLFTAIVHHIVGQQISSKVQAIVWGRLLKALGAVTPESVLACPDLRALGLSQRKVEYILDFARRVRMGDFDLEAIRDLPDAEAIAALTTLRGIGVWTAEMTLLFTLRRPDILSFNDFGIRLAILRLHRHRKLTPALARRYRRLYSPFGSVASLYLWKVANGAVAIPSRKETP